MHDLRGAQPFGVPRWDRVRVVPYTRMDSNISELHDLPA